MVESMEGAGDLSQVACKLLYVFWINIDQLRAGRSLLDPSQELVLHNVSTPDVQTS